MSNAQQKELELRDKMIQEKLSRIKNKIVIISGKGGVGKSTFSANLALLLSKLNHKVGLMDTDLHGPSITKILGLEKVKADVIDNDIYPVQHSSNLNVISVQFLLDKIDAPVVWRGPLKDGIIKQFITNVMWADEEYLVVDCPPGTGDEPLSVLQTIKDAKVVIVTTPQDVALSDVKKSIVFCQKLNAEILGVVENMSGFLCPHCGKETKIFNKGGGEAIAFAYQLDYLGHIPIFPEIVECGDKGENIFNKHNRVFEAYNYIVSQIIQKCSKQD